MLSKLKKIRDQKSEQGFTIIEVMIVLAIAGLIILVVLLAVPALQRNGRNTALKNDASAIAAGVAEFAGNNDGGLPTKAKSDVATPGVVKLSSAATNASEVQAKVQAGTTVALGTDKTAATITPAAGEITVTFGTKCGTLAADKANIVVSTRATSVVYTLETSGTNQAKCLDS